MDDCVFHSVIRSGVCVRQRLWLPSQRAPLCRSLFDRVFLTISRSWSPSANHYRVGRIDRSLSAVSSMRSSKHADVRLADFVRTALTLYLKKYASEIHETSKTPAHRKRGPR
jgi:hypothetical protein